MNNEARIDKWLWAARIFKTRTIAAAACKKGQVSMKGAQLKASRTIKAGDVVEVRKPPVTYSFRVLQPIERRVGAKLLPDILENITPPEQYELLEMNKISGFIGRAKGTGRPTKKDRRNLDDFQNDVPSSSETSTSTWTTMTKAKRRSRSRHTWISRQRRVDKEIVVMTSSRYNVIIEENHD